MANAMDDGPADPHAACAHGRRCLGLKDEAGTQHATRELCRLLGIRKVNSAVSAGMEEATVAVSPKPKQKTTVTTASVTGQGPDAYNDVGIAGNNSNTRAQHVQKQWRQEGASVAMVTRTPCYDEQEWERLPSGRSSALCASTSRSRVVVRPGVYTDAAAHPVHPACSAQPVAVAKQVAAKMSEDVKRVRMTYVEALSASLENERRHDDAGRALPWAPRLPPSSGTVEVRRVDRRQERRMLRSHKSTR